MGKKKNKRTKKNRFSKFLILTLIIVTIFFIGLLFYIDLLPTKYLVMITGTIIVFNLINNANNVNNNIVNKKQTESFNIGKKTKRSSCICRPTEGLPKTCRSPVCRMTKP